MELIAWLIVKKPIITFSRNFQFLNGYRLTSYMKLTAVSYWSQLLNIVSLPSRMYQKRRKWHNIAKPCIYRKLVQEFMKLHFQASVGYTYYSWTRTWQIACTVYRMHSNLFLCTPKNSKPYAFCSLSSECPCFSFFFRTHHKSCFVLWHVFHVRWRNILYATLYQIMCYWYLLGGRCRALWKYNL